MSGILSLLKSRKFWVMVCGQIPAILMWGEDPALAMKAVMTLIGVFIGSVALEDAGTKVGKSLAARDANKLSEHLNSISTDK